MVQHRGDDKYFTSDVVRLTGATKRQVDYWRTRGHIVPSGHSPRGSGEYAIWTGLDIRRIKRIVARVKWGLTLDAAARTEDPETPLPAPPWPLGEHF